MPGVDGLAQQARLADRGDHCSLLKIITLAPSVHLIQKCWQVSVASAVSGWVSPVLQSHGDGLARAPARIASTTAQPRQVLLLSFFDQPA